MLEVLQKSGSGPGLDHGFHGWARMGPGAEKETAERRSIRKGIWFAKGEFVNRAGTPITNDFTFAAKFQLSGLTLV